MSIELRGVSVRTRKTIAPVRLSDLNLKIGERDHLALLAPPNSCLNLVVDVICGAIAPDAGKVIRTSSVSWPLPSLSFLHKHLNFIANTRFIAQLYGADERSFIDRVLEIADIGDLAEKKVGHCPKKALSRFAFAVGACLPFDTYLFTSTNIGDKAEREKYAEMIAELGSSSGLIVATTSGKAAAECCDRAFVLDPEGSVY